MFMMMMMMVGRPLGYRRFVMSICIGFDGLDDALVSVFGCRKLFLILVLISR